MTGILTMKNLPADPVAPVDELLAGLSRKPRQLSPKYFYDEAGSLLFDQICELPEYYPTRTELAIMNVHAGEMAAHFGSGAVLIEPGAGSGAKALILLENMADPLAYLPVDISAGALGRATAAVTERFPELPVVPVCTDFTRPFTLPAVATENARRIVYFPGSTIGNFARADAIAFLHTIRRLMTPGGGLLIGVDLVKDRKILLRAYNDAAGVTARFNLNALVHVNREFGADFQPENFRHEAIWDGAGSRIEMRLVSRADQVVTVAGHRFGFAAGEYLVTEHSHKYTVAGFAGLARQAGLSLRETWTDPAGWFGIQYYV